MRILPLPNVNATLTLLSDLSNIIPAQCYLDFNVDGAHVTSQEQEGVSIGIVIDDDEMEEYEATMCKIGPLEDGYHLLRAFLIDNISGQILKIPTAYVEAEFYVNINRYQVNNNVRNFMFGQPSICLVSPRGTYNDEEECIFDYYVNNCIISSNNGYGIKILINGVEQRTLYEYKAFMLDSLPSSFTIQAILVNPEGKEVKSFPYNYGTYNVEIEG